MKIWNWIDGTLLNTSFRRRQILGAMVRLYWLWQCIWIAVLLFRLTSVQSYDSLFSLQGILDEWNGSFLVRLLFQAIQGSLNPMRVLTGSDTFGLVLTFLYMDSGLSAGETVWAGSLTALLVFVCTMAVKALHADSLLMAGDMLRIAGICGSAVILVLSAVLMYSFVCILWKTMDDIR
ncbi:hypothetical protein [Faecalibaculum rodentium]|uniref:hypothetical protein n=1 Tax=Faecalibaculum rodentium TaxID=1702221 RepID=UPI0023F2924A|nr:hypothetical protein [Faecalibaculum rodentium]